MGNYFQKDTQGHIICLTTYYENECESYCNQPPHNSGGYPLCISCCPCCIPCLLTIDLILSPCFLYYKCKEKRNENTSCEI